MKRLTHHSTVRAIGLALAVVSASSCGSELLRSSRAPVFLTVDKLEAAPGTKDGAGTFGSGLSSDVQVLVDVTIGTVPSKQPTVFPDLGKMTLSAALKNAGTDLNPATPTTVNNVTITSYHVRYRRTDGREREGIDVPLAFDGGLTATVSAGGSAAIPFELVRGTAKLEAPLVNLAGGGGAGVIETIAEVTFYGRDQVGNPVQITGLINVTFADFSDK